MKNLKKYILESSKKYSNEETDDEKVSKNTEKDTEETDDKVTVEPTHTTTFDFSDLENSDEIIKKIDEIGGTEVEGKNVTIVAKKDSIHDIDEIHDVISEYVKTLKKSQKRTENEQYAQKIKSFANKLNDLDEYIEQCNSEEE